MAMSNKKKLFLSFYFLQLLAFDLCAVLSKVSRFDIYNSLKLLVNRKDKLLRCWN